MTFNPDMSNLFFDRCIEKRTTRNSGVENPSLAGFYVPNYKSSGMGMKRMDSLHLIP